MFRTGFTLFRWRKYSVCPVCGYPAATKEDDEKLLMQNAAEKNSIKKRKNGRLEMLRKKKIMNL